MEATTEKLTLLKNFRLLLGWGLALILPFIVYFITPAYVTSVSARLYFALLIAGIIMWIFELVDSYIVGIFLVMCALVLRLAPTSVILSGYSSAMFFMAMGILALGSILINSGIIYRLLLHILLRIPNTHFWTNASVFFLGLTMTMTVPIAGDRVQAIAPFLMDLSSSTGTIRNSNAATKLAMSGFFSVSLFSTIFLSGSLYNFMLLGLLWTQDQERFQWYGWLEASVVVGMILVMGFALPQCIILPTKERPKIDREKIADQLNALGPISRIEIFAVVLFAIFVMGMLTQSLHRLSPQLIGLFILFALLVLGGLTRKGFQNLLNWPALFLLGSLIGLMNFYDYTHLNTFVVDKLGWLGWYIKNDFMIFVLIMIVIISLVRLVMPYAPAVVLFGLVFVPLAQHYEVNPWTVAFLVLFIGKMWFLPWQYPPFEDFCRRTKEEYTFSKKTIFLYNVYMNIVKIIAIYVSIPYWRMLGVL